MAWILLAVGIVHVVGIGWGLPASDGWDNDGVAPRDFLAGLAATVTPGSFYTYPPFHLVLLAVSTLPVTLVALVRAPSLALSDVVHEILKAPYMTTMALVARSASLVMSVGLVLHVARIAEELRARALGLPPNEEGRGIGTLRAAFEDERVRRAGYCAAVIVGIDASVTYYAHTSNLDVPYLFWASWSALVFTRALARRRPELLRWAFALAVLAVATKDQAYAIFLLAYPASFAFSLVGCSGAERRVALREAAIATALAVAILAVVDGAVVNPSGFRARVAFLLGSASQDYVEYTADWTGRIGIVTDAVRTFSLHYPRIFGPGIAYGFLCGAWAALRAKGKDRAERLAVHAIPFLLALSFTVAFNWTARRADARFLMPQALFLAVYAGAGLDALAFGPRRKPVRLVGQAIASAAVAVGIWVCLSVDANLLFDPRYEAEAWLREHVRPGDVIETYGGNVYMPRMPPSARVLRVGPEPVDKRNPMPGVEEVRAPFEDAPRRETRFIVLSAAWVWRYITAIPPQTGAGRRLPPTHARTLTDNASSQFFDHLVGGHSEFGYAHISDYRPTTFPPVEIHGTTARTIWIYERRTPR
jgi:hypothetical protein